jgi:preprotein translocase subunit SecD
MIRSHFKKYLLTAVLSVITIIPVMAQFSKTRAVFTMKVSNRAVQQDSVFMKEMFSAIKNRLGKVYPDRLQDSDLVQTGDHLELRLRGKVDTALVKRILNRRVNLTFYSGYKDALNVMAKLKTKDTGKLLSFPPAEMTKSLTYLASFQSKDTLAIRKLTRSVILPAGLKWYRVPRPENITELYLLNTGQPIITGDQVIHAAAYFQQQGQPIDTTYTYANVPQVIILLNEPGRIKFSNYTREHLLEMVAIVTGDELIMAAVVTSEINEGSMLINSGNNAQVSADLLDKIGYPFPAAVKVTRCVTD